jgi:hypothetical protein
MAYIVSRRSGSWELRESRSTEQGPRSRTLASFRTLTPDVVERARRRAGAPLSAAEIQRAASRAGVPIAGSAPNAAAAKLLAELAEGRAPSAPLRRLLVDALPGSDGGPTDAERAAAPWIAATPEDRGEALRDLLLLADRLPAPRRAAATRFPRIESSAR